MTKKLKLTGDKYYDIFLPPKLVKVLGGKEKWMHLGIDEEKGGTTRYYLDGRLECKINWRGVKT